mmetsp:Transcript_23038/g.49998  ORF Transcript_23038/g.49998 Transcript_23038/m.49998 type:complete len:127 (-) Transcript_23038:331-711(-)
MVRTRNLTVTVTRYGSGTCCEDGAFSPGPAAAMCSPFDRAMTFYLLPISPPFFLLFILFLTGCLNMLILVLYDGLDCSRGLGMPLCVSREYANPFAFLQPDTFCVYVAVSGLEQKAKALASSQLKL